MRHPSVHCILYHLESKKLTDLCVHLVRFVSINPPKNGIYYAYMQFHNFSEIALFIGKLEKKGALKQKTRREPTSTKKTLKGTQFPNEA